MRVKVTSLRQRWQGYANPSPWIRLTDRNDYFAIVLPVRRTSVDLALHREAGTLRQTAEMVREEDGLPEVTLSAATIPDAADNAPLVFHPSAVVGLHGFVEPETVGAIVAFPPADAGSLLRGLADFAAHSLKSAGGLFVLTGTERLPDFIECLRHPDLAWVCALHCVHDGRAIGSRRNPRGAAPGQNCCWSTANRGARLNRGDGVISALLHDEEAQENRRSHHLDLGMELIISRLIGPGDLVCNPLLPGRKASALAAIKQGRRFVGADNYDSRLNTVARQLQRASNAGSLSAEG